MKERLLRSCIVLLALFVGTLPAMPQERAEVLAQRPVVPRLVRISGTLKDSGGKPLSGIVGATFSIYKDQEGGTALWMETQNVQLDDQGRYTVPLGATKNEGIPVELFSAAESRWLGVQVQLPGEVEQPRVLLVSVPYALKAGDAETLGGMPASAFVLAAPNGMATGTSTASTATQTSAISTASGKSTTMIGPVRSRISPAATCPTPPCTVVTPGGTAGLVPVFTDATTIGSSNIFVGGGAVGIGNASPMRTLDVSGEIAVRGGNIFMQRNLTDQAGRRNWAWGTETFNVGDVSLFVSSTNTAFPSLPVFTALSNGNMGIGLPTPAAKLDVAGTGNFTGSTTASSSSIVAATQGGSSPTAFNFSTTTIPPVAVGGLATATSGNVAGVGGVSLSPSGYGVGALNFSSAGGIALAAFSAGTGGSAVEALSGGTSGGSRGIHAAVLDSTGVAGLFDNDPGGDILIGRTGGSGAHVNQFRVDGTGKGFFNGGTQTGGADFAESVAIRGEHSQYEPGDVLVVDRTAGRRLMRSQRAYSTRVAGIYSTKPGVLATTHSIDESDALAEEIPLAIVGIVPCKVTAENGPIAPGDLLVTSSTPGYAMKGTNRARMLGAVVGKALEPLRGEKGVIQVLVTLQ